MTESTSDVRPRTIADLCMRSHLMSKSKGWYNGSETDPRSMDLVTILFASEASEALEEWRANHPITETYFEVTFREEGREWTENVSEKDLSAAESVEGKYGRGKQFVKAKPMGVPPELSDVAIRVAQWIGGNNLDARRSSEFFACAVRDVPADMLAKERAVWQQSGFEGFLSHLDSAFTKACDCKTSGLWSNLYAREGLPSSAEAWLAFAMRMLFDYSELNGLDLWASIEQKEDYNRGRSFRHGGKRA